MLIFISKKRSFSFAISIFSQSSFLYSYNFINFSGKYKIVNLIFLSSLQHPKFSKEMDTRMQWIGIQWAFWLKTWWENEFFTIMRWVLELEFFLLLNSLTNVSESWQNEFCFVLWCINPHYSSFLPLFNDSKFDDDDGVIFIM